MLERFNRLLTRRNLLLDNFHNGEGSSYLLPARTPVRCLSLGTRASVDMAPGVNCSSIPEVNNVGGFLWNGEGTRYSIFQNRSVSAWSSPCNIPIISVSSAMDRLENYLNFLSSEWWLCMDDHVFVCTETKTVRRDFTGTNFYTALQTATSSITTDETQSSILSLSSYENGPQIFNLENKTNFMKQDWGSVFYAIMEHRSQYVKFINPYTIPVKIKLFTQSLPVFSFQTGVVHNTDWQGRVLYSVVFGAERTDYPLDCRIALSNMGKYFSVNDDGSLSEYGTNDLAETTYLFEEVLQNITHQEYEFTLEAGGEYIFTPPNNSTVDDFSIGSLNTYCFYNVETRFSYAVQPQF